jgi:hypothetical protein
MAKKKLSVDEFWGVPFPKDLHEFHVFAKKNKKALDALDLVPMGPLEFLSTGKSPEEARYYNDPPEFVTVLGGLIDGLHWGYWFDAPGELEPVVASYYANDAFELSVHGGSLFDAAREHLEALQRDAKSYLKDDPEYADDYREQLKDLASARSALSAAKKSTSKVKRSVVAQTRSKVGIVVPKKQYRALSKADPFETWNYEPKEKEVKRQVESAKKALADGFPGTALKLGHDLWIYRAFRKESAELLDLAYAGLGREVLRAQLKKASAWRTKCDSKNA